MTGPAEDTFKGNLDKPLRDLLLTVPDENTCAMGVVTDPKLKDPARVRLILGDAAMAAAPHE